MATPKKGRSRRRERKNTVDYAYRARAVNRLGAGPWSSQGVVWQDYRAVPSPPDNVTHLAHTVGPSGFTLMWELPLTAAAIHLPTARGRPFLSEHVLSLLQASPKGGGKSLEGISASGLMGVLSTAR